MSDSPNPLSALVILADQLGTNTLIIMCLLALTGDDERAKVEARDTLAVKLAQLVTASNDLRAKASESDDGPAPISSFRARVDRMPPGSEARARAQAVVDEIDELRSTIVLMTTAAVEFAGCAPEALARGREIEATAAAARGYPKPTVVV